MGNKLEQLLNALIQRGWKPFGITCTDFIKGTGLECIPSYCFNPHPHMGFPGGTRKYHRPSLRQIVSKESGLWQFVCENKLLAKGILDLPDILWKRDSLACMRTDLRKSCYPHNYEYRIIESALCDEDKLEEFLLSNIKVGNED